MFALVGEGAAVPGGGGTNPSTTYNREGVDVMLNPIPNGGLNIFGAWEIAQDPTGMIAASPFLPGNASNTAVATSGVEYHDSAGSLIFQKWERRWSEDCPLYFDQDRKVREESRKIPEKF